MEKPLVNKQQQRSYYQLPANMTNSWSSIWMNHKGMWNLQLVYKTVKFCRSSCIPIPGCSTILETSHERASWGGIGDSRFPRSNTPLSRHTSLCPKRSTHWPISSAVVWNFKRTPFVKVTSTSYNLKKYEIQKMSIYIISKKQTKTID